MKPAGKSTMAGKFVQGVRAVLHESCHVLNSQTLSERAARRPLVAEARRRSMLGFDQSAGRGSAAYKCFDIRKRMSLVE